MDMDFAVAKPGEGGAVIGWGEAERLRGSREFLFWASRSSLCESLTFPWPRQVAKGSQIQKENIPKEQHNAKSQRKEGDDGREQRQGDACAERAIARAKGMVTHSSSYDSGGCRGFNARVASKFRH